MLFGPEVDNNCPSLFLVFLNLKNRTFQKANDISSGFGQGPISSWVRVEGKGSAILFGPDANVDICITLKAQREG